MFLFCFQFQKILEFKVVHEVCMIKVNKQRQIFRNTFTPPPFKPPYSIYIYVCVRAMPRHKIDEKKVPIFKKTTVNLRLLLLFCHCILHTTPIVSLFSVSSLQLHFFPTFLSSFLSCLCPRFLFLNFLFPLSLSLLPSSNLEFERERLFYISQILRNITLFLPKIC